MIVIDAHCDTLLKLNRENNLYDLGNKAHVDLKRLLNNVDLEIFAVYIESSYKPFRSLLRGLELIENFHQQMESFQHYVKIVSNQEDLISLGTKNKTHVLLSVEGGEILNGNMNILHLLFRLAVRSICLTWNQRNEIADGCWESNSGGGLTSFGTKVVSEMNKLGMIIDVSHISEAGFWSVLEQTTQPIMVSHANCRKLCHHKRNLNDEQIIALSKNQGVMGITFVPDFLGNGLTSVDDVIKHIDYAVSLVGPEYVGIGSDFDGTDNLPGGLKDVTKIFLIADGLAKRGYSDINIEKIMGGNYLRLFNKILPQK